MGNEGVHATSLRIKQRVGSHEIKRSGNAPSRYKVVAIIWRDLGIAIISSSECKQGEYNVITLLWHTTASLVDPNRHLQDAGAHNTRVPVQARLEGVCSSETHLHLDRPYHDISRFLLSASGGFCRGINVFLHPSKWDHVLGNRNGVIVPQYGATART